MREYKIIRCDLGWNIYKKLEKNGYISLWFLGAENKRVLNKNYARTFYHREDAESALILSKVKDRGEEETLTTSIKKSESEDGIEKRSWQEL